MIAPREQHLWKISPRATFQRLLQSEEIQTSLLHRGCFQIIKTLESCLIISKHRPGTAVRLSGQNDANLSLRCHCYTFSLTCILSVQWELRLSAGLYESAAVKNAIHDSKPILFNGATALNHGDHPQASLYSTHNTRQTVAHLRFMLSPRFWPLLYAMFRLQQVLWYCNCTTYSAAPKSTGLCGPFQCDTAQQPIRAQAGLVHGSINVRQKRLETAESR